MQPAGSRGSTQDTSNGDKNANPPPVTVKRMTREDFEEMQRQADERYRNRPRPVDKDGNIIEERGPPVCRLPKQPWPLPTVSVTYANPELNKKPEKTEGA